MKITKMSLVAALLVGTSGFALDNIQMGGDANLFYQTADRGADSDLFEKKNGSADAGLNLNLSADILKNDLVKVSGKVGYTVLSTLGLENTFVSNVWAGAHEATAGTQANFGAPLAGVKVENADWVNEAYIAATVANTTVQLGRMELDTPLAFTEKWTIEKNTFEAVAVINQDIPDTTLVGAYVGNGNGTETFAQNAQSNTMAVGHVTGGVVNQNGDFTTYGSDGAYAFGVVNNSFKPLTMQGWYYHLPQLADAYWVQADLACQMIPGLMAGAQYTGININTTLNKVTGNLADAGTNVEVDATAYAVMLGYAMENVATVKVAFSQTSEDHSVGFNTATAAGTAQSKLYTEAWWNYGFITQKDTTSFNVTVEGELAGTGLGLYFTNANAYYNVGQKDIGDLNEITVTATRTYGPIDMTVAYINAAYNAGDRFNTVQAYITANF